MASYVGKSHTIEVIIPIITDLIKDESSEVRLNVTANLKKVSNVLEADFLSQSMINILDNLCKDTQWRVQSAAYNLIGDLIIDHQKAGHDKLFKFFMGFLSQPNASVREQCVEKLGVIAKSFPAEWSSNEAY